MRILAYIAHAAVVSIGIATAVVACGILIASIAISIRDLSIAPIAMGIVISFGLFAILDLIGGDLQKIDNWALTILSQPRPLYCSPDPLPVPTSASSASGPFSGGS